MGHRLTTALIFLNALGVFACLLLIAANSNQTTEAAIHFTRAIRAPMRLFIIGTGLPLIAWEIYAAEFNRANHAVRSLESWATYLLLIASWALFFIAAWWLPTAIVAGLRS